MEIWFNSKYTGKYAVLFVVFFIINHIFRNAAIWKHVPEKNIYVLTGFKWITAVYHF